MREGSEPDVFWNALGGKAEFAREKEIKGHTEDPHLFMLNITDGRQNIFLLNFSLKIMWLCLVQNPPGCKTFLMAGYGSFGTWCKFSIQVISRYTSTYLNAGAHTTIDGLLFKL